MQVTAIELLALAGSIEDLRSANFTDEEKTQIGQDILKSFPQPEYCVHSFQTRLIVLNKLQEFLDGFSTKETKTEKPKQSRSRKAPAKSPKK